MYILLKFNNFATYKHINPMVPDPRIKIFSPILESNLLNACTATAKGSINAPSLKDILSSKIKQPLILRFKYSA